VIKDTGTDGVCMGKQRETLRENLEVTENGEEQWPE